MDILDQALDQTLDHAVEPPRTLHPQVGRAPRVLLVDRGDPLADSLSAAMRQRHDVVGEVDVDLHRLERLLVAGATVRPTRQAWADRFFKSNLGVELRSRRARDLVARAPGDADVVFQTHALFETSHPRTVMYIDCTHRQSMRQWPEWNPLRGPALQWWLARERRQYQQSAHLFAFYEDTARSIIEEYDVPAERVSVVGAGVNLTHLPAPAAHRSSTPTILFVGNDFHRKGGPELLEAFAIVRRHLPATRLQVVGTPHPIPDQDGVEQLGRIRDRDHLMELYAGAHVFCLPSRFDPFPGVLLEAMAHGLPSVVSPVCGIPEMVVDGQTALTVPHDASPAVTAAGLAAALEHLLTHPEEAARMGAAARHRVQDRFTWPHVLDRMAPALAAIVADRGKPTRPGTSDTTSPATSPTTSPTPTPGPTEKDRTMTSTTDLPTRRETFVSDRPWGAFEQLSLNETSTVKVITVEAGSRLSLQRHEHRDELWQVLDGPMDIQVGDRTWVAQEGEHVWVPAGADHRMGNSGAARARILEVAFGHFDEEDIERLEDDFGR